MIHEQFIPGRWQDDVDVNDFLSLNKKPFLKDPFFLKNSSNDAHTLQTLIPEQSLITPEYASLKDAVPEYLDQGVEKLPGFYVLRKMGYTDTIEDISKVYGFTEKPSREKIRKTPSQLLSEVATSETTKMIKIGLFEQIPIYHSPSYIHPDVRRVALYGTKRLVEDKRYQLKLLEKHLQTHDWIEQRIATNRAIESLKDLERFAKKYGIDVSSPAESAKEAIYFVYLTILACMLDNPSISFGLTQVISFLDVYIEQSMADNRISEEEVQALIDEFAVKLNALPWTHRDGMMETITAKQVTKTTYRFLQSMQEYNLKNILLHVEWVPSLHKEVKNRIDALIKEGFHIRLYNHPRLKETEQLAMYQHGQVGRIGEEAHVFTGLCNLEKVFYLALNGGKDVSSNSNLKPITQPLRKETLEYEDVYTRFKDYLSYVLSDYVELANIILYVNETSHNHPLRTALMDSMIHFKIQFGFKKLYELARLFHAIEQKNYTFTKDSKGWIISIQPGEQVVIDAEVFLADLITTIEEELKKIPMYNKGKAQIRFEMPNQNWQIPVGFDTATVRTTFRNVDQLSHSDLQPFEVEIQ